MPSLVQQCVSHLAAGGTVLTASRRQAGALRRRFDETQLADGRRCWPAADVLPVDAWLAARWQELGAADPSLPLLLSDVEAAWPWRLAAGEFVDPSLVALADLSSAARRAWLTLLRHGGTLGDVEAEFLTRDQRQFLHWAGAVQARLEDQAWLDPGRLELALAERVDRLPPSKALLLAGFDRPTPVLQRLMQRLASLGTQVEWAQPAGGAGAAYCHAAADAAGETRAWLGWLRDRLLHQPDARLAVVVPDLPTRRAAIERALDEHLQPELELPGSRERDRLYDLAGGEPLAALGLAAAVLDVLACLDVRLGFTSASRLLRAPHAPAGDRWDQRTRLDLECRRKGLASWQSLALAALARREGCPGIADALEECRRLAQGPPRRTLDEWAEVFGRALAAWGWPGSDSLSSDEYQAAEAVRNRLSDFARLARTAPRVGLDEARGEFRRLLELPFQPERGAPSVWILDKFEPTGMEFDGLWVAGLTAAAWPAPARHDPFLPLSLQRRLGMPGVTAEDGLTYARQAVTSWRAEAAEVVFSWPCRQDDADMEPSRVLPASLPALQVADGFTVRAAALQASGSLEAVEGDAAPALQGVARGGTRILELQAKCPFRAFAELRLHSRPLEEPATGVDPRLRGTLLHDTLERAWRELAGHDTLSRLTPSEVEALVERCVEEALAAHLPGPMGERARELEADWQRAAALHVLEFDRQRGPFEVVATEQDLAAELAGLPFRVRVDRVDRIEGGLLVLDYKTGRATPSQWRGTRPDAPQLPLYAILKGEEVGGIAFMAIDDKGVTLKGLAREPQCIDGLEPPERFALTDDKQKGFDWNGIRDHWRAWLARLASEHREGVAVVDPKQPTTCRYCHLATLCRVAPGFDPPDEDGDDD